MEMGSKQPKTRWCPDSSNWEVRDKGDRKKKNKPRTSVPTVPSAAVPPDPGQPDLRTQLHLPPAAAARPGRTSSPSFLALRMPSGFTQSSLALELEAQGLSAGDQSPRACTVAKGCHLVSWIHWWKALACWANSWRSLSFSSCRRCSFCSSSSLS